MYTLKDLQDKNLKELKEIGWQLNVMPEGDRRCRQNWIDAIAGKNPPLLELLEASPVEVEPAQEPIEVQAQEPSIESPPEALECPSCGAVHGLYTDNDRDYLERLVIRCKHCNYSRFKNYPGAIRPEATEPPIESKFGRIVYPKPAAKPIANKTLDSFAIGDLVESLHERWGIEEKSLIGTVTQIHPSGGVRVNFGPGGTYDYSRPGKDLILIKKSIEAFQVQEPIANAETRPQLDRTESADVHNRRSNPAESVRDNDGAKTEALGNKEGDRVLAVARNSKAVRGGVLPHQSIELAAFNDDQPPNRGDGKGGRLEIEPELSQSAIGFCASPVTFSPRFLATYPPYFGDVHYKAEETGQLNLLESVETDDEPPDPDDFELLEDFKRAIALWDAQHPPEPLEVSLDSMCEWAPCPDAWYEPAAESSSTCNFSIPTFDAWCDRAARQTDSDEPPDTGNYARLPGPKPPKFPPRAIGQSAQLQNSNKSTVAQNQIKISPVPLSKRILTNPETISILFHRVGAGSSQPGRAPPGGDAM